MTNHDQYLPDTSLSAVRYVPEQATAGEDDDDVYSSEKIIIALRTLDGAEFESELSQEDGNLLDDLEDKKIDFHTFIQFILKQKHILFKEELAASTSTSTNTVTKQNGSSENKNEEASNKSSDSLKLSDRLNLIDFIFNGLYSLFSRLTPAQVIQDTRDISALLSEQRKDDKYSEINIKLLCLLFNLVPHSNRLRADVLLHLLKLAKISKITLAAQFKGRLALLPDWIKQWNLSVQETRELYHTASHVARRAADEDTAQNFLIAYLKQWNTSEQSQEDHKSSEPITEDIINEASQAVIAAISSKTFNTKMVMELNHSHIVKEMSTHSKFKHLYQLLNIVYEGKVKKFIEFYNSHSQYIQRLGLELEPLLVKMRLLTLCSLGNHQSILTFKELKNELQVKHITDIEEIIVNAVTQKLMHAKIDYLHEHVIINRSTLRVFNQNSWPLLAKKLSMWRQNTNTVLQIVHSAGMQRYMQDYIQSMAQENAQQ